MHEKTIHLPGYQTTSTDLNFLQDVYDTCSIEEVKKRLKSPIDTIFYRKGAPQNSCFKLKVLISH